jgi:hypothetical protein
MKNTAYDLISRTKKLGQQQSVTIPSCTNFFRLQVETQTTINEVSLTDEVGNVFSSENNELFIEE